MTDGVCQAVCTWSILTDKQCLTSNSHEVQHIRLPLCAAVIEMTRARPSNDRGIHNAFSSAATPVSGTYCVVEMHINA